MKQIILSIAMAAGISSVAAAQTSGGSSSNGTSVSSASDIQTSGKKSTAKGKKGKGSKAQTKKTDSLDQSKMYNWKDGQRATPTGHEATGTGGGYAAIAKDSATAPRDSTKQQ